MITVLDGGMGKELRRIGAPFRQPEWSALALIEAPHYVRQAHQNFVDAGADVLITNSYAVVPWHIGPARFARDGADLASLSGRIAREVADGATRRVLVAGSLPPLFGSYEPEAFDADAAPALWRVLIDALSPHVDVWVAETLSSLAELRTLRETLGGDDRPFWAAFALADRLRADGRAVLRSGEDVGDIVGATTEAGAGALLFNCSQPEVITVAVREVADRLAPGSTPVAFGGYANAFPADRIAAPDYAANEVVLERRDDLTPDTYADMVGDWLAVGATMIGGCCDIYPAHIAELRHRVDHPG